MTEPNKDRLRLWVEALESGEFEQTNGQLSRRGNDGVTRYCCLGVAEVVSMRNGGPGSDEHLGHYSYLSRELQAWYGVGSNPVIGSIEYAGGTDGEVYELYAVMANDSLGHDFKQIAANVRKHYQLGEPTA